jgi:conjugal transfer ATP-binding protein TraC
MVDEQTTNTQPAQDAQTPPQKDINVETKDIAIASKEKEGSFGYRIAEKIRKKWGQDKYKEADQPTEEDLRKEKEMGDLDEFFENFDPKKDKKKLTNAMRKRIIEAEKKYKEGIISVKDLISPSSMEITTNTLKINNIHAKTYYVYSYPRYLEPNWLSPIINFDATFDLSLFIYPRDSAKIMKILRRKVVEMISSKHMNEKQGKINSTSLDTALEDAQELRVNLQRGMEKFFHVGMYITVYAKDAATLKQTSKQIETILGGQLVMTRSADFRTERGFTTCTPQAIDLLEVTRNMNSSPLSTTFPFISSDLTTDEGILYGINRHNNSLVIFDRFNLENANAVVFAKSGAGKSYAVKLEILRSLMMGTDVLVIDPENEYEELSKTVGGTYVRMSLTSDQRINPFDLPLPVDKDEIRPGELIKENTINLIGLLNIMLGKLTPEEEALMDKAILQTYELKGITLQTEKPWEYEMPTMGDLENVLHSLDGSKNLAVRLEKYTRGTFSGLFSDTTNVDLKSGLLVFCIRDLEEQLRPIAMYMLLNFIWNRVRSELKRRILVIDEAWHMVQYEDSGRFLHNLTKRARKYYLGITTITQDVEDFLDSKWGKPIITNSSMQLLLRQAPVAMDRLKKVFNLTDGEKYLLLNSNVGQGLFFAGNQHVAIQIIASFGEDQIITSNPEQLLARKQEE